MLEDQENSKERINFLVKEITLNRSLRYTNQQVMSAKDCDEMEDELRKLDPKNPLFYNITKKDKKISRLLKSLIILVIFIIVFVAFIWYFYMFYYDPFVYPYT